MAARTLRLTKPALSSALHLVVRTQPDQPSSLARDLVATAYRGPGTPTVRVIELFQPAPTAAIADLSLSDRDVPEIVALLHEVEAIHVHGVPADVALRCLPAVRPDVLADKRLVIHAAPADAPTWPGPIEHAPVAAIDTASADVLPRACEAIPLELDDGSLLAVVALVGELSSSVRTQLRLAIESLSLPGLRIEVHDEADVPLHERAARRRATQAAVLGAGGARFASELDECVAMGLPVVVLGEIDHELPSGTLLAGADPDRVGPCLRAWTSAWVQGAVPALDREQRRRWLAQR